jgi:hypothetical protein
MAIALFPLIKHYYLRYRIFGINCSYLPWAFFFPANFEWFTGIGLSPFPYLSNFRSPPAEPGVYPI